MPIDEFITTVFCWVEQGFEKVTAGVKLRTPRLCSRLSDSEVITMEIMGEFLGYDGDEAIWEYFKQHWAAHAMCNFIFYSKPAQIQHIVVRYPDLLSNTTYPLNNKLLVKKTPKRSNGNI